MNTFLERIEKGFKQKNHLFLIYGVSGVGKTTFCAQMPNPIFITTEIGADHISVDKFKPTSFNDVIDFIEFLYKDKNHKYQSIVIDSLDWLETIVHQEICEKYKVKSIELAAGGYGKGYVEAFNIFLQLKDALIKARERLHIGLICHADILTFSDPYLQMDYNRYTLKLHKKTAALFKEFVDCVLFANFKVVPRGTDGKVDNQGVRIVFTESRTGIDAKNRFALQFEMPLDWQIYNESVMKFSPNNVKQMQEAIERLLNELKDENIKIKAIETYEKNKNDINMLNVIYQRLQNIIQPNKEN